VTPGKLRQPSGHADRAGDPDDTRVDEDLAPLGHEQPGVDAYLGSGQTQAAVSFSKQSIWLISSVVMVKSGRQTLRRIGSSGLTSCIAHNSGQKVA